MWSYVVTLVAKLKFMLDLVLKSVPTKMSHYTVSVKVRAYSTLSSERVCHWYEYLQILEVLVWSL